MHKNMGMFRAECKVVLSEEWKNNRDMDFNKMELDSGDLQFVDDVLEKVTFGPDGKADVVSVVTTLQQFEDKPQNQVAITNILPYQKVQAVHRRLSKMEGRISCMELMKLVKTRLKVLKMVRGKVSRIREPAVLDELDEGMAETSKVNVGLQLQILRNDPYTFLPHLPSQDVQQDGP